MLTKLHDGVDPTNYMNRTRFQKERNNKQNFEGFDLSEMDSSNEYPLIPRCLPVKGALQCIEEFPKFSAECMDQFIHKRDIDFDEIEEHWIINPLLKEDEINMRNGYRDISETDID